MFNGKITYQVLAQSSHVYIHIYIYIYIYEQKTSVCMCHAVKIKQKTQRLFDEFSYFFNT